MEIKNVAVIGAGTMGNGIAHVFAQHDYDVILVDTKQDFLSRALDTIERNLERQAKKGTIAAGSIPEILGRVKPTVDIKSAARANLVVEAAFEDAKVKKDIFHTLDEICPETTIFATNTSSLPITSLAASTRRPDRVIGMHFLNPVPLMLLVEVIRGMATSDDTCSVIKKTCLTLGKTPVEVKDYPGFVANRILMPMINEAVYVLMEGVTKAEDIDTVMRLGANHPMGPLTLADFIGLDVCLAIMEVLYQGYSDSKYRPCPLLRKMVQAGHLGRKTGKGFFEYKS